MASIWPGARVERSIFGTGDAVTMWADVRSAVPEAGDCFVQVYADAFV